MGTEQLLFSWRDHQNDVLNSFQELFLDQDLVDVTLACDGISLEAHKMVLSAFSPYFRTLFQNNRCKHPIVIIAGVKYRDMKAVVDFMYNGDVNVPREHLIEFLKTANMLQVKGLSGPIDDILNSTYSLESSDVQNNISNQIPLVLQEKATQQKSGHKTACTETVRNTYPSSSSSLVELDTEYSQDVSDYIIDESDLMEAVTVKSEPEDNSREFPNVEFCKNSLFVTENSSDISHSTPSPKTMDSSEKLVREKQHLEEQVPQTISLSADISLVPVLLSQGFTPFQTNQDQENDEVLLPDDTVFQNTTSSVSFSGCTQSNELQAMLVSFEEPKVLVNYGMPFNDGKSPRKETIPEDSSTTNLINCPAVSDLETNTSPCKKSCTTEKAEPSSTSQTKRKLNSLQSRSKRQRLNINSLQSRSKRQRLNINYINFSKFGKSLPFQKHVIPKSFNPDYDCKCSQRCSSRISKETRMKLFNKFWSMANRTKQDAFIKDTVSETTTSYKYNKNSRQSFGRVYKLAGITVCYQMYASIMKINTYRISQALCASRPFTTHIKYRNMKIATANKYRLTSKKITEVMGHFDEFFSYASHHSNINLPIEFISNNLPLKKLYYIYKWNTAIPVTYYHFTKIFKNYFILALNKRERKYTSQPLNSNKDKAKQIRAMPRNQMKTSLQFNSNTKRKDTSQAMNSNKDKAKQMEATSKSQMKIRLQFDSSRERKDTSQPMNSDKAKQMKAMPKNQTKTKLQFDSSRERKDTSQPMNSDKAKQMKAMPKNQTITRLQFDSSKERKDTSQPMNSNKDKAKQMEATPKNQTITRLQFDSSRERKDTSQPMNSNKDKAKQMEATPKNQMKIRLHLDSSGERNDTSQPMKSNKDKAKQMEATPKNQMKTRLQFDSSEERKDTSQPMNSNKDKAKQIEAMPKNQMKTRLQFDSSRERKDISQSMNSDKAKQMEATPKNQMKLRLQFNSSRERKDISQPMNSNKDKAKQMEATQKNQMKIRLQFNSNSDSNQCCDTVNLVPVTIENGHNSLNCESNKKTHNPCKLLKVGGRPNSVTLTTDRVMKAVEHFNRFSDNISQSNKVSVPVDLSSDNPPLWKMYKVYRKDVRMPVSFYNYVKIFKSYFKQSLNEKSVIATTQQSNTNVSQHNAANNSDNTQQFIDTAQQCRKNKCDTTGNCKLDSRLSFKSLSTNKIAEVIDHFNKFCDSVQCSHIGVPVDFTSNNLPLQKMYKVYKNDVTVPVSYYHYVKIFNNNFKHPKCEGNKGNAIKILNVNNDVTNRNNSCDGKQRKEQPPVDKQNAQDVKMSNSNKIASHQHHTSPEKQIEAKTSKSDLLDKQNVSPKSSISISGINITGRNLTKASLLDEESAKGASIQLTKDTRQQSLNDISSSRIAAVIDHFNEFHNFVSRHNKRNVPLEFVNSHLPLMKMYKLYRAEVNDPVSYCHYLNIFRTNFKCLKEKDKDIDKHKDHNCSSNQPKEGKITLNNQKNTFKLREKTNSEGTAQNNKSASFDQCMPFTTTTIEAQNSNSNIGSEKNNMKNHQVNGCYDITWKHAVVHLDKITIPLKLQKNVSNEICNSDSRPKRYSVGYVESISKPVIHQDSQLQNVLAEKDQEIMPDANDNEKLCHSNTVVNDSLVKLTAENKTNTFDLSHRKDNTNIDPIVDNNQKFEVFHTEEMSAISELLSEIIDSIQDSDMLKGDSLFIENVDNVDAMLD